MRSTKKKNNVKNDPQRPKTASQFPRVCFGLLEQRPILGAPLRFGCTKKHDLLSAVIAPPSRVMFGMCLVHLLYTCLSWLQTERFYLSLLSHLIVSSPTVAGSEPPMAGGPPPLCVAPRDIAEHLESKAWTSRERQLILWRPTQISESPLLGSGVSAVFEDPKMPISRAEHGDSYV